MANWKSKIQLTRKNVVYQNNQNVRIIIQPSQVKTQHITSNRFVIQPNKQTPQNTAKQVKPPQQAAIAKITPTKRKTSRKTQIKYIKHQPNPESIAKIQNIQNTAFNRTLVIVGNGPSISEIPLEKIKDTQNIDVLSINTPDHRIWPTSHWAFFDVSQLRRHESLWNNYDGYIFNSTAIKRQKQKSMQFSNIPGEGFSKNLLEGLYIGRSSVYASMQIALWMAYKHVYILGVDMNPSITGQLHFYGTNPDVDPDTRRKRFKEEARWYDKCAEILTEDEKHKFTFCSAYNPWDFVKKFDNIHHKDAIDRIIASIN